MDSQTVNIFGKPVKKTHLMGIGVGIIVILLIVFISLYAKSKKAAATAGFRRSGYQNPTQFPGGIFSSQWHKGSVHDQQYFGPSGYTQPLSQQMAYMPAAYAKNALHAQLYRGHKMKVQRRKAAAYKAAAHRAMARAKLARARRAYAHREGLTVASSEPNVSMSSTCDPSLAGTSQDMCSADGGICVDSGAQGSDGLDVWSCQAGGSASAAIVPATNGTCPPGFLYDPASDSCLNSSAAGPLDAITGFEGDLNDPLMLASGAYEASCYDPGNPAPDPATQLSEAWDPDATAEAQALYAVGSYAYPSIGDMDMFENAVDLASSGPTTAQPTMTDQQLASIVPLTTSAP